MTFDNMNYVQNNMNYVQSKISAYKGENSPVLNSTDYFKMVVGKVNIKRSVVNISRNGPVIITINRVLRMCAKQAISTLLPQTSSHSIQVCQTYSSTE